MSRKDAELFEGIASFVIDEFIFYANEENAQDLIAYDILLHLQNCGLLNVGPFLSVNLDLRRSEHGWVKVYQNTMLRIQEATPGIAANPLPVPCVALTVAGKELLQVTRREYRNDYLRRFAGFLHGKNCRLSHSKVVERLPGGGVRYLKRFEPIEPESSDAKEANR